MDIAAVSVGLRQTSTQLQAGTMVLRKVMDLEQQQGSDMLSLLKSVTLPSAGLGENIDISA